MTEERTAKPSSWWSRNWKWVTPVGCLVLVIGFVAIFAALFAGIFTLVDGMMSSSGAYQQGVELAQAHPEVIAELGEPIEATRGSRGSINTSGPSGNAEMSIPLRGPKGRGKLYVVATKSADRWHFEVLEVAIDGRGERIELLADGGGTENE